MKLACFTTILSFAAAVAITNATCVVDYKLYNADTNREVQGLPRGGEEICLPDYEVNIEARLGSNCPRNRDVRIEVSGPDGFRKDRTEKLAPYFAFGNNNGDILGLKLRPGKYYLKTKVDKDPNVYEGEFTFKDCSCRIKGLELFKRDTPYGGRGNPFDKNVQVWEKEEFTIKAITEGQCDRVKFEGPDGNRQEENDEPYFLFGDETGRRFYTNKLREGKYKVKAIPNGDDRKSVWFEIDVRKRRNLK